MAEEKKWADSDMAGSIGLFLILVAAAGVAAIILSVTSEKEEA